jgi:DNA-binding transcriptional LysR family regulator
MDRLDGFKAFVTVVETGSFTAAASKLDLSRALISKRIAALEEDLGARLLNRTTRRLSVTGPGAAFHDRCVRILAEFEAANAELQSQQIEPTGMLKINAPMTFGTMHLTPAVVHFMQAHPKLQVQLTLNDRFVDLIDEGYDIGIRIGALADSSLTARRLAPVRRVLCASPAYVDGAGKPAHPTELGRHRCLHYGYLATGTRWRLSGPDGEHAAEIRPCLCVNNGEALMRAALGGLGVALLPTFICGAELQDGQLIRLMPDYEPPEIAVNAIWPTNRMLTTKVRRFIDFLVGHFGDRPYWDLVV